jgi:hypothetical protein
VQPITEARRQQKSERDAEPLADRESEAIPSTDEAKPVLATRAKVRAAKPAAAPAAPPSPPPPAPVMQAPAIEESIVAPAPPAEPFPTDSAEARKSAPMGALGAGKQDDRLEPSESSSESTGMSLKSAPAREATQSRAPAPSSSVRLRQNMHLAPEAWLAEITRLEREGHRQEAIENLRLFRRMHPDWKISDTLRRLAE